MSARQHTRRMLGWWRDLGIERLDLAVMRRPGKMKWHKDLALSSLPLGWAKRENVHQADVYVRPARGYAWPLVFLDDVAAPMAARVARKYDAMVVETSPAGGCHIWLSCESPLEEEARREAQRWLARQIAADPGSVSGEHLGRLAGFKNWKRGGVWVNVLDAPCRGRRWDSAAALCTSARVWRTDTGTCPETAKWIDTRPEPDASPSGKEWGWVCGQLEAGCCPKRVYARLIETARARRGGDAERYAQRTLERALERTAGHRTSVVVVNAKK